MRASDHPSPPQESEESGDTAGSIGRLPSLTHTSGRPQYCSDRFAASRVLRSHSGRNAGAALAHAPTAPEFVIPPHLFRVMLLERLQPLPVDEARCSGCSAPLDPLRRHRAACPRTARLRKRAAPTERMQARVCREAGARVRFNVPFNVALERHERGRPSRRRKAHRSPRP